MPPPWVLPAELPYRFPDLPGTGGRIKVAPEDFEVEEIAAYQPSGEGEHLFIWVEKRDVSSDYLLRHLARSLQIAPREIGLAGRKDRRAVTRQWVSIPAAAEPRLSEAETDGIRFVQAIRHGNKLRTGHLKGNRFSILIRDVDEDSTARAVAIAEAVLQRGFANYYGSQRFGRDLQTVKNGWQWLTQPGKPRSRGNRLRFELSAVQSYLFNLYLKGRIEMHSLDRVWEGDVMQVVESGGLFVADSPAEAQGRFESGEIVPTGPLFGPKMKQPGGKAAEFEKRVLADSELPSDCWQRFKKLTRGSRRALLVRPPSLHIRPVAEGLRVDVMLPPGCYATELLRELTKSPPATSRDFEA